MVQLLDYKPLSLDGPGLQRVGKALILVEPPPIGLELHVTTITASLANLNLEGQLSEDITLLDELQNLDLTGNRKLSGPIPQKIGELKKLKNLHIMGCSFSGLIPDSIGSLEQLTYLHFGNNKLTGDIPKELFSSKMNLIHVLFDGNEFTGPVPDTIGLLRIALGSGKGIAYLHELADPPIIHRDIKSNNILLDENLTAKVADFGLSKLVGDPEKTHVTTQVKGTMGYLDPEYYMTNQLTEKSDVYGYGVVMLELLTGKSPIERGKYVVREVKTKMNKSRSLYDLQELLDTTIIASSSNLKGFEKYVDLALRCVEEEGVNRPSMGEVVKEIENIMQLAGLNPNVDSASSSRTYEGASGNPYGKDSFDYSANFPDSKVEPQ
ncbi:unnamed protein product [Microthlaspi erraticum]|uniref:non-specific serine/threonine protein kinase n=1 Tax=Microthlaspi erraticum TaxID=1685480 RepID=A0A6D2IF32_9BRAS|nr:unnamed protein product [Microthlaspi erraticum]